MLALRGGEFVKAWDSAGGHDEIGEKREEEDENDVQYGGAGGAAIASHFAAGE